MDKYVKKWAEYCFDCAHGFKIDADSIESAVRVGKLGFFGKLLRRKADVTTENIKPKPSPCPVCGKADKVSVIELMEDKIYVQPVDRL